jgi:Xaa-Pro aminopeptidase
VRGSDTGVPYADRLRRVSSIAAGNGADAALVTNLPDVRWCCGFTGSNGIVLVNGSGSTFVTDGRYATQAENEVEADRVLIADGNLVEALRESGPRRLIYQADHVTVQQAETLAEVFGDVELLGASGLFEAARGRKIQWEVEQIEEALAISEEVLLEVPVLLREGMSERDLAAEIDYRQRLKGADGIAFDTIVAFGENAALPHARPGGKTLRPGECVLIDTGCRVRGFVSDITRNFFFGQPSDEYARVYTLVLEALNLAVDATHAGLEANALDAVARRHLDESGYGQYFLHSLGHGVGHEIHEWPRISRSSDAVLPAGAVITIEPGVYLSGKFGIRVEDMIYVRAESCERLNDLPTDLIVVEA